MCKGGYDSAEQMGLGLGRVGQGGVGDVLGLPRA